MPSDKTPGDDSFSTFFQETGMGKHVPRYKKNHKISTTKKSNFEKKKNVEFFWPTYVSQGVLEL